MAERAQLRSLDEDVAIARSFGRPQLSVNADVNNDLLLINIPGAGGRSLNARADLSLPLYAGGTIRNSVRAANTRVEAGRADLRATEGDTFTEATAAYMDVIRDRSIVQLNQNQVRVLDTNLQATRDRFEVGDLTRTDVAQSEARARSGPQQPRRRPGSARDQRGEFPAGDRRRARRSASAAAAAGPARRRRTGGLDRSRQQCRPRRDRRPGARGGLRRRRRARRAAADHLGGGQLALSERARHRRRSRQFARGYVAQRDEQHRRRPDACAGRSTRVAAPARASAAPRPSAASCSSRRSASSGSWSPIPVPPARSTRPRRRRSSRTRSRSPPTSWRSRARAPSRRSAPATCSTCSTPSRNCSTARSPLVTARRDAYVAGFQLLNAMGQAEAEDLNLDGGPLYDPLVHYDRYSGSWSDWDDGPSRAPSRPAPCPGLGQPGHPARAARAGAAIRPAAAGSDRTDQPQGPVTQPQQDKAATGKFRVGPRPWAMFSKIRRWKRSSLPSSASSPRTAAATVAAPPRVRRTPPEAAPTEEDVLELDDPVTEDSGLMSEQRRRRQP